MSLETPRSGDPHVDEDLCIDLVHGLLQPADRRRALDHAAGCAQCEALLRTSVADYERSRSRFAPAISTRRRPPNGMWLLAAGLAVVVGGAWLLGSRTGTDADPSFVSLPAADLDRIAADRDAAGADSSVLKGIEAYERGEFGEAVRLLQTPQDQQGMDRLRRVYMASALVRLGRAPEALDVLAAIRILDLPEPWRSETDWTYVLAFRATGQGARADSVLEVLRQGMGPASDRARSLRGSARRTP